jgi:hypothetical protein
MTQNEFNQLSGDLVRLAGLIPIHWGGIQNNATDGQINMFNIHSFTELERQLAPLSDASRNYFRRRWFLWKCAQCDEYLFYCNTNVVANPNPRDQSYDVEFNNDAILRFDIKGTIIPRQFRNDVAGVLNNPVPMIEFFYAEQSRGVRNNHQNRLFIVHHSHQGENREMALRCKFDFKRQVYATYSQRISRQSNFVRNENALADVIFILEAINGIISYRFLGV